MAEPQMTAADLMTRKLVTLPPDASIADAIRVLVTNRVSGVPVVDADGVLLGLVSEHDCLRVMAIGDYSAEDLGLVDTVESLMTTPVCVVTAGVGIYSMAHMLLTQRMRRLLVVDATGRLIGLVARRDVLRGVQGMIDRRQRPKVAGPRGPGLYLSATGASADQITGKLK